MTPQRAKPEIIDARRKTRIANGSGTDIAQVNRLLKQFQDMKKMMHIMTKGKGGKRSRMTVCPRLVDNSSGYYTRHWRQGHLPGHQTKSKKSRRARRRGQKPLAAIIIG